APPTPKERPPAAPSPSPPRRRMAAAAARPRGCSCCSRSRRFRSGVERLPRRLLVDRGGDLFELRLAREEVPGNQHPRTAEKKQIGRASCRERGERGGG